MKKIMWIISIIAILIVSIYTFNYLTLTQPALLKTESDSRNEGIKFDLHYKYFIINKTLVFDLKHVPSNKAIADVFRIFLQTTSALQEKEFETIELSYKGTSKFILKGDYYSLLGREYGDQNPVYTMRTLANHLYDMNGQTAYNEWSGGLLGVLSKQMEDFKDFHDKWYLNDMIK